MLVGTERATAGLVTDVAHEDEPRPRIGGRWVACDSAGRPRAILRTTELRLGPLARTTAPAPAGWPGTSPTHRTPQARGEAWSDELEVVFERFRVVWPPEVADDTR